MLARHARVRLGADHRRVTRSGARGARGPLVVHALVPADASPGTAPRAGFVVGRPVGNAVTRNRVRRRLQHLLAARMQPLPPGTTLVVRATGPGADLASAALAVHLDRALAAALRPRTPRPPRSGG